MYLMRHPPFWIVGGILTYTALTHAGAVLFTTGIHDTTFQAGLLVYISTYMLLFGSFIIGLTFHFKS
jgi:hypothetical protein